MKVKLILLDTPIIVSDKEIKRNDVYYETDTCEIVQNKNIGFSDFDKKIIAGLPELPEIDFNGFEEKLGIIDPEKLVCEELNYRLIEFKNDNYNDRITNEIRAGIKCFQTAQSLNNKKFSVDDMRKLVSAAFTIKSNNETLIEDFDKWFDNRIKTLSQPKVFDIEVEIDVVHDHNNYGGGEIFHNNMKEQPKITNHKIKITKII